MKITKWRAAGLALVTTALVAAVVLSTASAKVHATNLVIWTDANRAPAVTQLANAWASANGATVKVVSKDFGSIRSSLGTVVAAQFPKYTLDAFSYGTAIKKLYGIPVQVENIGLLVNTKLIPKTPSTFAQLESTALALKKKNQTGAHTPGIGASMENRGWVAGGGSSPTCRRKVCTCLGAIS